MKISSVIVICSLGCFIDIFDIQLFTVLRVASLSELHVMPSKLAEASALILNLQMAGMIAGSFLWGWLADHRGRSHSLYGSILVYSLGTLASACVHTPGSYAAARCLAGFGLAGETGAATTLLAETISPRLRSVAVGFVGGIAFLGPVCALLIASLFSWRACYLTAGATGLLLLLLRMNLLESPVFQALRDRSVRSHPMRTLLDKSRVLRLGACLLVGLPLVFGWNVMNFFSLELSAEVLAPGQIFDQKICLLSFYGGTSLGAALSGVLARFWASYRRTLALLFLAGGILSLSLLRFGPTLKLESAQLYFFYFLIGLCSGCWSLMTLVFAECFGANVRATASTVLTNAVRALSIPALLVFQRLHAATTSSCTAALILGIGLYPAALIALTLLVRETYGTRLDYVETEPVID